MRIYIIGGPGSGKTTLAMSLSRDLGVPLLQLDDVWVRSYERERTDDRITPAARKFREELVADYTARDAWVIEGAEPPFLEAFAQASDLIVWCDLTFNRAAARMIRRHVLAELRRDNRYPGWGRLFRFLRSVRRRYVAKPDLAERPWTKWTRAELAEAAGRHERKVLRLGGGSAEGNLVAVHARIRRIVSS
jgi:AAA domain-containing protein